MIWTREKIVQQLKRLHKAGRDLSYNRLARTSQALLSAAAYHFDSYRRAIETAGISYDEVVRRPRWTRQQIITLIKTAKKKKQDLHWSAVTRRRDELGKAAFASLQPRLFGKWSKALRAAGLDAEEISRYRHWDRNTIVDELKSRSKGKELLNSGALQEEDAGLHAAAVRHFGGYDAALRAAKLQPERIRRRRKWNKAAVVQAIRTAGKSGNGLADSDVRKDWPALYGAAVRLFGAYTTARNTAGVKFKRKKRGPARRR
jgi:hypothetical protein